MRYLILALPLASLGGCASTGDVRGLADRTGVFVTSLHQGTSDFLDRQNELNADNAARLDQLVATGAPHIAAVRQQHVAWQDAGDETRLKTFDAASARSADEIVAGLASRSITPTRISASALAGYASASDALARVASKPKPFAAMRELAEFGQSIMDEYGKLKDAAAKDAAATVTATKQVDTSTAAKGNAAATPN